MHILIEHQSTPDKHMAFRLIRYAVAAMQRHLDAGHKKLPLVVPILFYMGKRSPYPYSTNWLKEFIDPAQAQKLYSSDFPLVDITRIPDDDIMQHRSMAALTLLQKHIRRRDLAELSERLSTILRTGYLSSSQIATLIHYIIHAGDSANAEIFIRELANRVPQYEEELMTIAQQLEQNGIKKGLKQGIEQGIEQGREQGLEQGREQGLEQGKRDIARNMLQHGIDPNIVMKITALSPKELAQLCH